MDNRTLPTLNPHTPLAYLPPDISRQYEATCYLYVATLAAYAWDMICSVDEDYRLLRRYPIDTPTIAYFISRITTLGCILTGMIFQLAPISSCQSVIFIAGWFWAVATSATSLLFFFRVRAVFERQRFVVALFAVLSLATLVASLTVRFSVVGGHVVNTDRCTITAVKPLASVGFVINTFNNTLMFVSISWRIITGNTVGTSVQPRVNFFSRGRELPHISRELLRNGQLYYLMVVGGNILTMAIILSPSVPPLLHVMPALPNTALENAMACRVFRKIKPHRVGPILPVNDHTPSMDGVNDCAVQTIGGTNVRRIRSPPPAKISGRRDVMLSMHDISLDLDTSRGGGQK